MVEELIRGLASEGLRPDVFLVNDGSTDNSMQEVRALVGDHPEVRYISFSRNFGKETALMAGLLECGDDFDALAYMDSDGQHRCTDLVRMIGVAQSPEVDLVCGVRDSRNYQTASQQRMARLFYALFRKLSDAPIDEGAGDFNVLKPPVVAALRSLREEHPFMKGLVGWVGFRKRLIPISIAERAGGQAKSSTRRMLKLAFGAILSFSSWPLRAWSAIGMVSALLAVLYLALVVVQTAVFGRNIPGYATTVVLLLGLGGLQLLSIGIVGEYLARVYDASKQRPRYLVAERSGALPGR
ncbi:glycosyltransferase family 2 protein [Pararoseomonas sp. SCSIO 73927]|uniref:glycosyltransferase family 2 protein n=1 Tax=Pararoseomonas sp. SCSIO 73927 TaxID=3114537 RepID=UPI0030CF2D21